MIYAYHRTSTKGQHLDRGIFEINDFCQANHFEVKKIFLDQQTGKNFDRPEYRRLFRTLRKGDVLIVTELDRFGRNKKAILGELRKLQQKEIRLMILEIPTTLMHFENMDNQLAAMMMETINNMLIEMYASLAQAEMEKKEKRQKEGIEAMKRRGEWDRYGRPHKVEFDQFRKAYQNYTGDRESRELIMEQLGLSQSAFYYYRKRLEQAECRAGGLGTGNTKK